MKEKLFWECYPLYFTAPVFEFNPQPLFKSLPLPPSNVANCQAVFLALCPLKSGDSSRGVLIVFHTPLLAQRNARKVKVVQGLRLCVGGKRGGDIFPMSLSVPSDTTLIPTLSLRVSKNRGAFQCQGCVGISAPLTVMHTFSTKILLPKLLVHIIYGYICIHVCMLKNTTFVVKSWGAALYVGAYYTWVFTVNI